MSKDILEFYDIWKADRRIRPYVKETPLDKSIYLSNGKHQVFLKLECAQPVKAFKVRGAFNKILNLNEEEKENEIVAISSGNHGIAVAYVTKCLGLKQATIIVPRTTPVSKIEKIEYYGAKVIFLGNNFDESYALGMEYIKEKGGCYIDGWDQDVEVYAGQGTAAMELLRQNPEIDTILVPIGGGGLCTGTAVAAKAISPNIKVYGLYTESCPAWVDSIRDRQLYNCYESEASICEAMVGGIGHLSYHMQSYIDGAFMVKESMIKKAMIHSIVNEKIVTEAAGAVPIAAMLQYQDEIPGKNIALLISGGNLDNDVLFEQMKLH